MPNYQNGKIYKIVCNITGEQYIGSTTQALCVRKGSHKADSTKVIQKCAVSTIILRGDYDIVLIENYLCNNKEELHKRERYHIENTECINKRIPTRTPKERYIDTREQVISESKKYYADHKEQKKEYDIKYRLENEDRIKLRADAYKERSKMLSANKWKKQKLLKALPFYNYEI